MLSPQPRKGVVPTGSDVSSDYDTPVPVGFGDRAKQGLGSVAKSYIGSRPIATKGFAQNIDVSDLGNLYKFFTTGAF